jgi:hypothetical protein
MSHPVRFLVAGGLLVMLGGCSDTAPTAPAGEANPPRISAIGKPTRSPVPFETAEFQAGEFCSFPVLLEWPEHKYTAKTFPPEPNGDVVEIQTGKAFARYTNLSTGKSITYNVSGPTRLIFHPDGSLTVIAPGPQLFFDGIHWGNIVGEFSPDGELTLIKVTGRTENVCAALS